MTARRVLAGAIVLLTCAFFTQQFSRGIANIDADALPGFSRLSGAVALLLIGQVLIGEALVALRPLPATDAQARRAFHLTQPSKYVPAGVAQAVGLIGTLGTAGVPRATGAATWIVHIVTVILGGIGVGLVAGGLGDWSRWLLALAALIPFTLWQPVLTPVVGLARRLVPSTPLDDALPSQRDRFRCLPFSGAGLAVHGAAFALLVTPAGPGAPEAIAAYALAHGVATATPLPGGLGAREALMFALLDAGSGNVLSMVLLVRLLLMGVEAVLFALAAAATKRVGSASTTGR